MPPLDRQSRGVQLDLFRPSDRPAIDWRSLPTEVREKVTHMMVRMLRAHGTPRLADGGQADD